MKHAIFFTAEYSDYLVANGYSREDGQKGIHFTKADVKMIVRYDTVDVFVHHLEEPGQRCAEWSFYKSFTGLSMLNQFSFFMLMHVLEVVPLQQFIKRARNEGMSVEDLGAALMKHFRVNEVPAAY